MAPKVTIFFLIQNTNMIEAQNGKMLSKFRIPSFQDTRQFRKTGKKKPNSSLYTEFDRKQ
jgi:hypothetical protein